MKKTIRTAFAAMAAMVGMAAQKGEAQNTKVLTSNDQKKRNVLVRPVYEGTAREYGEYLLQSGKYRHNNLKRKICARGLSK